MALSDNYQPDVSIGNGTTIDFSGIWKVFNADYFILILQEIATGIQTVLTLGSDYTLTFDDSGYQVSLLIPAPTSAYYIIRARDVTKNQTNPYTTSKGFQGEVIEDSFDKITAITQDMQDGIDRSLKFQIGSLASGYMIQDPINGRALKWDTVNNRLINSDNDPDTVYADSQQFAQAAQAAANTAIAQAGNAATSATLAQSWAIAPIGSRPEGSAKYWAEQAAAYSPPNNNWTATVDPTVTNDQSQGWTKGSQWYNSVSQEIFVCADNTIGAAVWIKTTLTIDEIAPLLALKSDKIVTVENITASRSLTSSDNDKVFSVNGSGSNVIITVPDGLPQGFNCTFIHRNSAQNVTVSMGGVETLAYPSLFTNRARENNSTISVVKRASTGWQLIGDMAYA